MKTGELFAGIGGLGLGLEATGKFEVAWQVEKDDYAMKILNKHWPDVPKHDDVTTFPPKDGDWDVDLLAGGFPCQDVSVAGNRKGITGERSGLFFEVIRIAKELRPKWILLENVTGLLVRGRGMGSVLGELAEIGYDSEWHCISASACGASHKRDRVFIISTLADTDSKRLERHRELAEARQIRTQKAIGVFCRKMRASVWADDTGIRRVSTGIPNRVDRIRCLGNSVCPQVAQFVGMILLDMQKDFVKLNKEFGDKV
jgi:DNA (cytosine-5)-methyltransferase 1